MTHTIDDSFNKKQYETYLQYYLDSNIDQHVGGGTTPSRVTLIQKYLPKKSIIFEIGSGNGTDALALQEAGYTVTASDFSEKFVEVLQGRGLQAILFDAKQEAIPHDVDAIYANAVFVHFHPKELKEFLHKAKQILVNSKIIYFSVIAGEGSERRASSSGFERDFQYYSEDILREMLFAEGYRLLHINIVDKWIQIIAQAR